MQIKEFVDVTGTKLFIYFFGFQVFVLLVSLTQTSTQTLRIGSPEIPHLQECLSVI